MRLHPPLPGPLVITQPFGVNPQVYAKWNLPGHDGLDMRAAEGTPTMAVDDGTVALVSSHGPYGLHYRIVHAWGESIHAHLSKQYVTLNQKVKRGQVIGLTGNTGNSTGPHLHFSLRVSPFFRNSKQDKWQGFCDPAPYFQAERFLISPHIHFGGSDDMLPVLRQWQPPVALVLDPNPDFIAKLKTDCPNTLIVGRIYAPDSEVAGRINTDPIATAQWMDNLIRSHRCYGQLPVWQVVNEVCQGPDWDPFVRLNTCMNRWIDLAANDYRCALYGYGVGNPDAPVNDPNWWNLNTPVLSRAAALSHYLLIHEYGTKPVLDGPLHNGQPTPTWHVMRYVNQVRPYLLPRTLKVIVGEFGRDDRLIGLKTGWKQSELNADQYTDALIAKERQYALYRDQIIGACVFTWQPANRKDEWESYDIAGPVSENLAAAAERLHNVQDTPVTHPIVGVLADSAWTAAAKQKQLSTNSGAALQRAIAAADLSLISDEFSFSHDGVNYIGQLAQSLTAGDKKHLFYAEVGKWDDVKQFTR